MRLTVMVMNMGTEHDTRTSTILRKARRVRISMHLSEDDWGMKDHGPRVPRRKKKRLASRSVRRGMM